MGEPEQLAAGIERLAAYAREAGRNPTAIDIIYRTHDYQLGPAMSTAGKRHPLQAAPRLLPMTFASMRRWG